MIKNISIQLFRTTDVSLDQYINSCEKHGQAMRHLDGSYKSFKKVELLSRFILLSMVKEWDSYGHWAKFIKRELNS